MNNWDPLLTAAMLGTQRSQLPAIIGADALCQSLGQIPLDDPAHALLSRAGVMTLHRDLGWQPAHQVIPMLPPRPADTRPVCPPEAAQLLEETLKGQYSKLLGEFLTVLADAGWRLPPYMLPQLLARSALSATYRPQLLPVLGETGRWLADQNPAWAYASHAVDTWDGLVGIWQRSQPTQRQALLQQLRWQQPALGRELLVTTWKSEPDRMRVALLRLLAVGLDMGDEPFLERALDDRVQMVRQKAAELLASLPDSRLCQRMADRVGLYLRWSAKNGPLLVTFPPKVLPSLLRDGMIADGDNPTPQSRSRQLTHMVGAVPLSWWTGVSGLEPAEIIREVQATKWPRSLLTGLVTAVFRQQDVDWALALLRGSDFQPITHKLVTMLPVPVATAWWGELFAVAHSAPLDKTNPLVRMLEKWPHPWPVETAVWWIERLAAHFAEDTGQPDYTLRLALKRFSHTCPPGLLSQAQAAWEPFLQPKEAWRQSVQEFLSQLAWRQRIRQVSAGDDFVE